MKSHLSLITFAALAATALGVAAQNVPTVDHPLPAAANSSTIAPAMSYGVGEVMKMYQGGIGKDVILSYIHSTSLPYHLTANDVIYLHSIGMPEEITTAMIVRGGELQREGQMAMTQPMAPAPNTYTQAPPPQQVPPPQQIVVPSTPAPDVTYVGGDAGYPYYYNYPDSYYWPPVVIGGGWGWGGWGVGRGWGWGHGYYGGGYHGGYGGFHGGDFGGGFHGGGGFGGHGGGGFGGHGGGGFGGHGGGGHR